MPSIINLYKKAFSGLNKNIWLLALVMLINRSGTMVLAFMTLYGLSLGYTIEQAGFVVAVYGAGSIVGALIGGKLSDLLGFYYVQVGALVLGGFMFYVTGWVEGYVHLCVAAFVLSMVNESFRPANASAIAHYSTPENRTQSFSLIRLAINLGWGVGAALGGFLANISYKLLFWVDGSTSIFAAILLFIILPKVKKKDLHAGTFSNVATKPAKVYHDVAFMKFLLLTLLFAICFFQLFSTLPMYLKEGLKLSEGQIGLVMSGNGVLIALFEMVVVYKLEGRHRYLKLIYVGSLLMGVAFLSLLVPLPFPFLSAVMVMLLITLSEMVAMPFMNSFYLSRTTVENRGAYAGFYTMCWSAAQVVGSSGGAVLAHKIGFSNLWLAVFILCAIAAFGYKWLKVPKSSNEP